MTKNGIAKRQKKRAEAFIFIHLLMLLNSIEFLQVTQAPPQYFQQKTPQKHQFSRRFPIKKL
jgi:hypothetical protein